MVDKALTGFSVQSETLHAKTGRPLDCVGEAGGCVVVQGLVQQVHSKNRLGAHFTVEGTLNRRSFEEKDDPPARGNGYRADGESSSVGTG